MEGHCRGTQTPLSPNGRVPSKPLAHPTKSKFHVPCSQPLRYFSCVELSLSMLMPIDASLSRATYCSISIGTSWTGVRELALVLDAVFGGQGLGGEAHVHDARRMAFGHGQVDQPACAEHVDALAVLQRVFVDLRADVLGDARRFFLQGRAVRVRRRSGRDCRRRRRPSSPGNARGG